MLSIVIPSFNESRNIGPLVTEIGRALENIDYEIIFVDDSTDDTPQILERVHVANPKVGYLHREGERGLGTAVVRGFELAKGDIIAVMDADLQHPPSLLPRMLIKMNLSGADVVIPSRFVPGGSDGGLAPHRKLISYVARKIGQLMLTKLRTATDATSGVFMFRREVIKDVSLDPIGWKILIEILIKGKYSHVVEIPYKFQARTQDHSKMNFDEQLNYLKHLAKLVKESPEDAKLWNFIVREISIWLMIAGAVAAYVTWQHG